MSMYCEICKLPFENVYNLHFHYSSEGHQSQVRLLAEQSSHTPLNIQTTQEHDRNGKPPESNFHESNNLGASSYNEFGKQNNVTNQTLSSADIESSHSIRKQIQYEMFGSKGKCYVCNIDLTSKEHKQQHIDGMKHKKKAELWSSNLNANPTLLQREDNPIGVFTQRPKTLGSDGRGKCNICEVEYTSAVHAKSHLEGKNHKKKAASFGPEFSQGQVPMCSICKVPFSSLENAEQHFQSEKHKRKELYINSNDTPRVVDLRTTNQTNNVNLLQRDLTYEINEAEKRLKGLNLNESVAPNFNNTVDGMEKIADKDFLNTKPKEVWQPNSIDQCSMASSFVVSAGELESANYQNETEPKRVFKHGNEVNGEVSERKLQLKPAYTFDGSRGKCHACSIEFTSKAHAQTHVNGKKHKKREDAWYLEQKHLTLIEMPQERKDILQMPPPVQNSLTPVQRYFFSESKGFCFACSIELTSRAHADQHLSGKQHKRMVERANLHDAKKTFPLFCDACGKKFSGQESAQQHFLSEKHKQKELLSGEKAHVLFSCEEYEMIILEGQKWVRCKTCLCNLNTKEQFDIHKRSPKHLVTAESKSLNNTISSPSPFLSLSDIEQDATVSREATPANVPVIKRAPSETHQFLTLAAELIVTEEPSRFAATRGHLESSIQTGAFNILRPSVSRYNVQRTSDGLGSNFQKPIVGLRTRVNGNSSSDNSESPTEDMELRESNSLGQAVSGQSLSTGLTRPKLKSSKSAGSRFQNISTSEADIDESSDEEEEDLDIENMNIKEEEPSPDLENILKANSLPKRSPKPNFKYFCEVCEKHMATKREWQSHIQGQIHRNKSALLPVQSTRDLGPLSKENLKIDPDTYNIMTKSIPRSYQHELLEKTLDSDTVVFLPTGTGKTLVAVSAIAYMLKENKTRPTIFLVDKVLLVLQQHKYIQTELADCKMLRPSLSKEVEMEERNLLIGAFCGAIMSKHGLPMWKYDVIVTTAAYCNNILKKGLICWSDFSLAVMDEVHHCRKHHPYKTLLSEFHAVCPRKKRPKVLGLTASPAGKKTMDLTYEMLKELLQNNLNGAKMAIVEEEGPKCELKKYQSNCKIIPECVQQSSVEEKFLIEMMKHFLECYSKLASMCRALQSRDPPQCFFNKVIGCREKDALNETAKNLVSCMEPVEELMPIILNAQSDNNEEKYLFGVIRSYIAELFLIIPTIVTCVDKTKLDSLLNPDANVNTFANTLTEQGINMQHIYGHFRAFIGNNYLATSNMIDILLLTLQNPDYINWKSQKALILVQQRKEAHSVSKILKKSEFVLENELKVKHLVGHGRNARDDGMKVRKQKQVLDKQTKYNILVATSIAEEGLDIQTIQLVVCLNPPNSVKGLVQIRGRARRANSYFVILCDSQEKVEKLRQLQMQEENMLMAAKKYVDYNN